MIPKPLDKIEAADIQALVANGDEERRTMDFKRDLPGNADKDKNELRADATSFANAGGGDLIFGVDEVGGAATAVPGLPGIDADAEIRRIEAVIQSSIDPRVPGFESRAIPIPGKGPVILVRVPKSWRGPHLVKINDTFRMFGRNSKGKYIFDATEIRSAFVLSEQLPERIRRWRDDRLASIIGGDAPALLEDRARLILHLVPLASFTHSDTIAADRLAQQSRAFRPPGESAWDHRINIDGFLTFSGQRSSGNQNTGYCQVFRSARVEAVTTGIVHLHEGRRIIAGMWWEKMLVDSVSSYLKGLRELEAAIPVAVLLTIAGAKGAVMAVGARFGGRREGAIDRDVLLLPDVLFESFTQDVPQALRPIFDAVWNACGWERSINYDAEGKWAPR